MFKYLNAHKIESNQCWYNILVLNINVNEKKYNTSIYKNGK